MNWGKKLVIAMALFMSFIIALSVKMILSDKDDLVEKDYYEKGLSYDQDYSRKMNVEHDKAAPSIIQEGDKLNIRFSKPSTGTLKFIHSKDRKFDRLVTINSGAGIETSVPLKDVQRGSWRLTFEWKSGDKMYMYDKEIFIQ